MVFVARFRLLYSFHDERHLTEHGRMYHDMVTILRTYSSRAPEDKPPLCPASLARGSPGAKLAPDAWPPFWPASLALGSLGSKLPLDA